ncbi:MAG: T9SS type A sorting domain-containing protein, partial [Panacibacter sp.]
ATTDQIDQVNDGVGTQVGRSRVWRLRFDDIANPELGGTVEAVLDGTEGQNMLDNIAIDKYGHITLLEDVGNSAHNGKVWQYDIATDALRLIGKHDPARFGDIGIAATSPFNQDEESSGVIDVQEILGPGMYLIVDQAHSATGIPSDLVENGQLMAIYNCTPSYSFDTVTVCGSYIWNGQTYDSSGTYAFTGTNAAGCDSVATLTLTVNKLPIATATTDSILCFGGFSKATINVTGGISPFQYQLNFRKPQSSNVFTDLNARTYQVTVTDSKNCSQVITFSIAQPAKIQLVLVEKVKPSCQGGSDGDIIVTATGGAGSYQYSLNNGPYTSSGIYGVFNGLSAGTYSVSVKDANGCVFVATSNLKDGRKPCAAIIASQNNISSESSKLKLSALNIIVFPNPATVYFTLLARSSSNAEIQVMVTDIYGKNVFSAKGASNKQYTFGNNFAAGIYLVKVIQGSDIQTIKIIKGKG